MFSALKGAQVHVTYRRAARILSMRGMSSTLVFDPYSGAVDVYGAILLAHGAKEEMLAVDEPNPVSCGVPDSDLKPIVLAVDFFEAMTGMDIFEWSHSNGMPRTVNILEMLASRIDMSVTSKS